MKYFKKLLFDKEVVKAIRNSNVDSNYLYSQLFAGKITLPEYLQAVK